MRLRIGTYWTAGLGNLNGILAFGLGFELPHKSGLSLNFLLQCPVQGLPGTVQQHTLFRPGNAGIHNLPGKQAVLFIIGQNEHDVIELGSLTFVDRHGKSKFPGRQ